MQEQVPAPGPAQGRVRARLQAVVAVVLVIAFLKWSAVATMPVAFALFLIALVWPLQRKLENRLPSGVSFVLAVLVLLLIVGLFIAALWWTGQAVAERSSEYAPRLQAVYQQAQAWARSYGIELGMESTGGSGIARRAAGAVASSVSMILLILALAILGLHEVRSFRRKSEAAFGESKGRHLIETVETIASKYQRYLLARTVAALIQGVSVWLFSLAMGLDFSFVWGLLAFLLNYIPTIGSAVAVVPPVLFSLIQFDGLGRPLAVLLGMALLQLLCGNYVDPLIQGKLLALSPVVVLASIVFWGWVWGIPGALLGVPITIGIVIATDHFSKTRWIARMLAE
ncbi:MAG: transport protein TqsA [Acidobacteriota bacterium]|jgi:predicted PurR-regulated permease PerM|nr:transport protein TqsA [Acidobacteriota bacterium]